MDKKFLSSIVLGAGLALIVNGVIDMISKKKNEGVSLDLEEEVNDLKKEFSELKKEEVAGSEVIAILKEEKEKIFQMAQRVDYLEKQFEEFESTLEEERMESKQFYNEVKDGLLKEAGSAIKEQCLSVVRTEIAQTRQILTGLNEVAATTFREDLAENDLVIQLDSLFNDGEIKNICRETGIIGYGKMDKLTKITTLVKDIDHNKLAYYIKRKEETQNE